MQSLLPIAEKIAARLIERRETIAIAESSTGGLIARLCSLCPALSAYFVGGAVVYTKVARVGAARHRRCRHGGPAARRPKPYSLLIARRVRERHGTTWGLGETGATGPKGNRYGDAAGHTCMAVAGPIERSITLETGSADRRANMDAFAKRALELLAEAISAKT